MAADPGATTALPDDVKRSLKSIVLELRHLFEADLGLGLRRLGIDAETGKVTPADDLALSYLTAEEREARSSLDAVLAKEAAMTKDVPEAVRALLREAAYTHLNRLIGLKCLELRGHLTIDGERTEVVTQRSDFGDLSKYLWTLRSRDARLLGDPELLWREGLLRACTAASAELGVLFDPKDPYAQVWPSHKALVQAVRTLDELPESAFHADELLGWVYQYFQSEEKDRVFAEVRTKKKKIAWADIVPVTQLYTERYMVDFLLQNSIGARWMEMYPDSRAKEVWLYYVEPATPHSREPRPVKEWTLLDPCCGSGHFLVVAFDLLVHLYAEERALAEQGLVPSDWAVPEAEVARTILERNLHGIDIDPRAVQLSALALYLKAKELGLESPPQMNLVIADCVLQRGEHYQALLDAYKYDPAATKAIEAIWGALENVRDLGSLVRIEEEVEKAVVNARKRSAGSFDDMRTHWGAYKTQLITRLKDAFDAEAPSGDEGTRLFGAEAQKGLGLFELLSARYDVVCTNPPYMGSKNMGEVLQKFVQTYYQPAKRDLSAALLMKCCGLCKMHGYVSMVTQQSWMFTRGYSDLRLAPDPTFQQRSQVSSARSRGFGGLLRDTSIEVIAHLGEHGFQDSSAAGAFVALFTLRASSPTSDHRFVAFRLVGLDSAVAKAQGLLERRARFEMSQGAITRIPEAPLVYWAPEPILVALSSESRLRDFADVRQGIGCADVSRFVRYTHEMPAMSENAGWVPYHRGGGYRKWYGLNETVIDWRDGGRALKESRSIVPSQRRYSSRGLTYTDVARGSMSTRVMDAGAIFSDSGPGIFAEAAHEAGILAFLNSRLASHVLRLLSPAVLHFRMGYVASIPVETACLEAAGVFTALCVGLKRRSCRAKLSERVFRNLEMRSEASQRMRDDAICLTAEAHIDTAVFDSFGLTERDTLEVFSEVGVPAGWHPLVSEHDTLPELPDEFAQLSEELQGGLIDHKRLDFVPSDLQTLKLRLCTLFVDGPNGRVSREGEEAVEDDEEQVYLGAHIPIPPETFLEELSQGLKIHPISVYWLLEELREQEGLVSPPEAKREMEDWLSVTLLRMLGHRWPLQDQYELEEGKPFLNPVWTDADGLIAVTAGMGEEALSERFSRFLDDEFGPDHGRQAELALAHTLGWKPGAEWGKQKPLALGDYFKRDFFRRHVSQFKRRPIAWHLRSPKGTVQLIVYYHAFNRDRLALLRARYLGNLRQELNGKLASATAKGYEDRVNVALIDELEEQQRDLSAFDDKLAQLQEGRECEARIWCPWKTPEEQPHGWDPDINDGVRVNIAPLQRLGLLASDALANKDLKSLLAPEERE